MWAIVKKEFQSYFLSPIGYIYIGIFLLMCSIFFYLDIFAYMSTDFTYMFGSASTVLTFIVPLITMRMFSEERKNGTEQLLLTSPRSVTSIVLGKFIAAALVVLLSVVLKAPMDKLFLQNESLRGIGLLGPGLFSIFIVISLLYWTNMARMTRGQILALKGQEFVTAARALGTPHSRIIFKHLIPNAMGAIIVSAMVQIPNAIFVEAFLSFLGLGVSAPMVSLGSLTSNAVSGVYSYPYQLLFPAALISIIILCFNLVGDGLRDALDPRMKNR